MSPATMTTTAGRSRSPCGSAERELEWLRNQTIEPMASSPRWASIGGPTGWVRTTATSAPTSRPARQIFHGRGTPLGEPTLARRLLKSVRSALEADLFGGRPRADQEGTGSLIRLRTQLDSARKNIRR
jgi:hypothetical protein